MTDADVDGAHIRTLLLTLFYRYFAPIIENGYLYIAQPPLYRIQKGKEVIYTYTDEEKDKIVENLKKKVILNAKQKQEDLVESKDFGEKKTEEAQEKIKGVNVQRYKGLGEMNPDQLWKTTMDPEKRTVKKITIENAREADRIFDILMGSEVAPRKKFIQTHAKKVKNLDI